MKYLLFFDVYGHNNIQSIKAKIDELGHYIFERQLITKSGVIIPMWK